MGQAEDRVRAAKALELKLAGVSYDKIAEQLGYSTHASVVRAVQTLLNRHESPLIQERREQEDARLDALLRAWWVPALQQNPDAAKIVLSIHQARVKLHGLAMPEKMVIAQISGMDTETAAVQTLDALRMLGIEVIDAQPEEQKALPAGAPEEESWSNLEETDSPPPTPEKPGS